MSSKLEINSCFMLRLLTEIHSRVHDFFFSFKKKEVGMREDNSRLSSSWNITAGSTHPVKTVWKDSFCVCVRISLGYNQNGRSVYASLRMFTEDRNLFSINNHREPLPQACFSFFLGVLSSGNQPVICGNGGAPEWVMICFSDCQKELE